MENIKGVSVACLAQPVSGLLLPFAAFPSLPGEQLACQDSCYKKDKMFCSSHHFSAVGEYKLGIKFNNRLFRIIITSHLLIDILLTLSLISPNKNKNNEWYDSIGNK